MVISVAKQIDKVSPPHNSGVVDAAEPASTNPIVSPRDAEAGKAPLDIEDCNQVYGDDTEDEFACLDKNDCTDDGGHVFLNGVCIHCGEPG